MSHSIQRNLPRARAHQVRKKGRAVDTVTRYGWFGPDGHEYTGYADPETCCPRPVPEVPAEYKKAMAVVALESDDLWGAAWGKLL